MNKRINIGAAALSLIGFLVGGCSNPAAPASAPRLHPTEATSLQAPFVLRLQGPAAVPVSGPLSLTAVVETAAGGTAMPIDLEVIVPSGVTQLGASRQTLQVGGATSKVTLPLSFSLTSALSSPITVRASYTRSEAMSAVAERLYPEPTSTPPAEVAGQNTTKLPGLPVGTPTETVR